MEEYKKSTLQSDDTGSQIKFWGTLALAGILLLVSVYFIVSLSRETPTPVIFIGGIAFLIMLLIALISAVLTLRHRQELGLKLLFYAFHILIVTVVSMLQGRTIPATFTMLLLAFISIRWLFPRQAWRRYALVTVAGVIVIWTMEWINPAWRAEVAAVSVGPAAAIVLGIVLILFVAARAWRHSMRNKVLVAFISVTVVTTGALAVYVYTSTTNILQDSLESTLTQHTDGIVVSVSNLVHGQVTKLTTLSLNDVLLKAAEESNSTYTGSTAEIQAVLDAKDAQWLAADTANNNSDPLVQENLTNEAALELVDFQGVFPEFAEVFVTDAYGGLVGTSARTSDFFQADEGWWQAAYNDGAGAVYISNPAIDASTGTMGIQISMPLKSHDTHEVVGILRVTYNASELTTILAEKIGQTGETDLFIPGDNPIHFHEGGFSPVSFDEIEQVQSTAGQGVVDMIYEDVDSVVLAAPVRSVEGDRPADKLGWLVVFHQQHDEAFTPVNAQVRNTLLVMAGVLVLAVAAAFGLALVLVRPITRLTQTAEEIAAGNIEKQAEVTSSDEVGILATTFNTMTAQLRDFIGTLEERVAERTKDQATVAEIATQTATIQDLQEMLATMVHLTQRGFGLYHAHVFLYHEGDEELHIVACGYKEGDEHEGTHGTTSIPLAQEQSLVARAGRERTPVIVNDVQSDPGWLPNPLLPDTHAEMAVPMIVGDKLLGVLDVQAEQVDAFDDADATIQMTLAAQVAVAVQNILQFQTSQKMAADMGVVTEVGIAATTISDAKRLLQEVVNLSKESFNLYHAHIYLMNEEGDTLQLASGAGEVGQQMVAEGRSIPLDSEKSLVARAARTREGVVVNDVTEDPEFLPNPLLPDTHAEMAVPMIVAGKVTGVLDVQSETVGRFTELDVNIQTTLASQVAIALENARSFQEAQKQAERETMLNLITQRIQDASTIEDALQIAARELGQALGKRQTLITLESAALAGSKVTTKREPALE